MPDVLTISPDRAFHTWSYQYLPELEAQTGQATVGRFVLAVLGFGAVAATTMAFVRDPLSKLFTELDGLQGLENTNGYIFRATDYAHEHATQYLNGIRFLIARDWRLIPSLIPDGEGGIDIEWDTGNKKVALSCRGRENQRDFIYWRQNGGRYEGREASPERLTDQLNWLVS